MFYSRFKAIASFANLCARDVKNSKSTVIGTWAEERKSSEYIFSETQDCIKLESIKSVIQTTSARKEQERKAKPFQKGSALQSKKRRLKN